jgi:hypothetical protein
MTIETMFPEATPPCEVANLLQARPIIRFGLDYPFMILPRQLTKED